MVRKIGFGDDRKPAAKSAAQRTPKTKSKPIGLGSVLIFLALIALPIAFGLTLFFAGLETGDIMMIVPGMMISIVALSVGGQLIIARLFGRKRSERRRGRSDRTATGFLLGDDGMADD